MKALIILATLLAMPAFADEKPFMEFGDIKGDVSVIDHAEESANEAVDEAEVGKEARTFTVTNEGEETAGKVKELDKSSPLLRSQDHNTTRSNRSRAQDYNSSRCNRRGIRLDEDSDDDGLETKDNAVDNDCDDDRATGRRQHRPVE